MKINNKTTNAKKFAYDHCHKMYLLESRDDEANAIETGYDILRIAQLKDTFENSCGLRFISNWRLTTTFVQQFEDAHFEGEKK